MPDIDASVFVADGAQIVGNVRLGKDCSVWFNAVIRGDVNHVKIGERTNIQDGCLLHVTHEEYSLTIGSDVTVGHGAILHGCTVNNYCLIGMGSIILDNAQIGPYALVAAGSVVREQTVIPEGVLAAGVPAKVVRNLSDDERKRLEQSALNYVGYAQTYRAMKS